MDGTCVMGTPVCEVCDEILDVCVECDKEISEFKVIICHIPPGNPEKQHTIIIGLSALPAHIEHGDTLGYCDSDCQSDEGGDLGVPEDAPDAAPDDPGAE